MADKAKAEMGGSEFEVIPPKVTNVRKRKSHSHSKTLYRNEKTIAHTTRGGKGAVAKLREKGR